jgi:arylsulfatase A-like enzyme
MVQWKGRLPAGELYDQPVASLDILPTAVTAAGGSLAGDHPLDGVDLVPYLTGHNSKPPHDALYWRFGAQWAIRQGDFKLLHPPQSAVRLFNLAEDVGEQHDLAGEKPQLVKELETAWNDWNSQLMAPRWKGQQARAARARRRAAL